MNDITNDLILKYDEKFNKNYDKKLDINSSIMNKEELIIKINNEIEKKEINIEILKYSIFFVFFLSILIIFYGLRKFTLGKLFLYIFILLIIYFIFLYINVFRRINKNNLERGLRNIRFEMNKYGGNLLGINQQLQCPSDCPPITPPVENPATIQGYVSPTLKTDPQLNVWEYGDIPTDLWTSSKLQGSDFYTNQTIPNYNATLEEEMMNSPKPFFGTTYPSSTYYKCSWMGGDVSSGLPNLEGDNKYSSIPCSYRPNFTEKGRFICTQNPNNIEEEDFHKYCNDVSVGDKL